MEELVADKAYDNKSFRSRSRRWCIQSMVAFSEARVFRRGIPEMDWTAKPHSYPPLLSGPAIAVYLACIKFLIHMLTAGNY